MAGSCARRPRSDQRGADYSRLTALLIEATKEQQAEIQALEQRLSWIEAALASTFRLPEVQ